jgi:hypothetical protein
VDQEIPLECLLDVFDSGADENSSSPAMPPMLMNWATTYQPLPPGRAFATGFRRDPALAPHEFRHDVDRDAPAFAPGHDVGVEVDPEALTLRGDASYRMSLVTLGSQPVQPFSRRPLGRLDGPAVLDVTMSASSLSLIEITPDRRS